MTISDNKALKPLFESLANYTEKVNATLQNQFTAIADSFSKKIFQIDSLLGIIAEFFTGIFTFQLFKDKEAFKKLRDRVTEINKEGNELQSICNFRSEKWC